MWPYFHLMSVILSLPGRRVSAFLSTRDPASDALFHTDVTLITRQSREHDRFRRRWRGLVSAIRSLSLKRRFFSP